MRAQSSYCIASTALLIGADDLWHGVLLHCPCWSLLSFSFTHSRWATVWPCPAARLVSAPCLHRDVCQRPLAHLGHLHCPFIVPSILGLVKSSNRWSTDHRPTPWCFAQPLGHAICRAHPRHHTATCWTCCLTLVHDLWTIRKATKITKWFKFIKVKGVKVIQSFFVYCGSIKVPTCRGGNMGEHGNISDQAWKAWGCQNISKHVKTTYAKLPNCVLSYVLVMFRIFPCNWL